MVSETHDIVAQQRFLVLNFLQKPLEPDVLAAKVRAMLDAAGVRGESG